MVGYMRFPCWINKTIETHTHSEYIRLNFFPTAIMVTRTRPCVTFIYKLPPLFSLRMPLFGRFGLRLIIEIWLHQCYLFGWPWHTWSFPWAQHEWKISDQSGYREEAIFPIIIFIVILCNRTGYNCGSMLPQHQYKCNVKNSTLW